MWRHIASNALTVIIVGAFLLGGVILWASREYRSEGPLTAPVCVQVPRGSNLRVVSENLAAQGAVSSSTLLRVGADYAEKADDLKAGSFLVPEGASMAEIVDIITQGGPSTCGTEVVYRVGVTRILGEVRSLDPESGQYEEEAEFDLAAEERPERYRDVRDEPFTQYRLVIAEGVTSWQVVQALGAIDVLEGEIADIPDEGTLAPQSYALSDGMDRAALIADMQARQSAILADAWENRAPDLPLETPQEALILASIIEKETGVPEERGQVASVFVNRLDRGMRLQTDPTVIYGVTEGRGVLGRGIRQSELRDDNPWNTYVIDGLPVTPIANPGRASIESAVNPEETPFVFFVADGTGGHAFAETLEEHNRNVARWRQIESEQANQ